MHSFLFWICVWAYQTHSAHFITLCHSKTGRSMKTNALQYSFLLPAACRSVTILWLPPALSAHAFRRIFLPLYAVRTAHFCQPVRFCLRVHSIYFFKINSKRNPQAPDRHVGTPSFLDSSRKEAKKRQAQDAWPAEWE